MVMTAFLAATVLLFLSGLPGLLRPRGTRWGERVALALTIAGSALGTAAAVGALLAPAPLFLHHPWPVPGGAFVLQLDPLVAAFLLPIYFIVPLGSVYGLGYWSESRHPESGRQLRFFYGMISAALTLVLAAANGILFLVAWEIMAIAGFFLVCTEHRQAETRRAGFIYLVATHAGTLALFALFVLLGETAGSYDFPAAGSLAPGEGTGSAIFLLGLFGFGLKAGLMPLHVWLPGAHAAAPSHISALLSGVMIKSGIYGLVRVTGFFADIPVWWGWTVLVLGAVSGVMGVAFAIAQHDIKRLLAYHSVENIGIIAIGLGIALLGRSYDLPPLVVLGLAGALLHVINHGLFKSLLFLGAGALIHATASRDIDHYGGLLRPMPVTGFCFLGGAVAISGLPPLNGFVSEWLIYLGLLGAMEGDLALRMAAFAAPVLALIGALALACFVKVFGAAFLGEARPAASGGAHEAPAVMRLPMVLLLVACAWIGLFPATVFPLLARAAALWHAGIDPVLLAAAAPPAPLTGCALALILLTAAFGAWRRQARRSAPREGTWGCGYAFPTARMQYTASSFAEMLVALFRWGLRPDRHGGRAAGLLPGPAEFASHTPDTVLDRLMLPLGRVSAAAGSWLRARMQHGVGGLYLLYIALTLCFLLVLLLRG